MPAPRWGATLTVTVDSADVSCDVTTIDFNRGRLRLWDPMQAATADVYINVGVGSTTHYLRGPVGTDVSIAINYGGIGRQLFTGKVQLRQVLVTPQSTLLNLYCVDGFELLARRNYVKDATAPYVGDGETITDRINRWLDAGGWPTDARALDTTTDTSPKLQLDGNVLREIQRTVLADGGDFFIDGDGTATFKSYGWRATVIDVSAIFSDQCNQSSWVPYSSTSLRSDLDEVHNSVDGIRRKPDTVGALDPLTQNATNLPSITQYGPQGDSMTDLELETDTMVHDRVGKEVAAAAQPMVRFDPVVVQPMLMPSRIWPKVLGIQWGSRVLTNRTWPDGSITSLYGHVIGERWRLTANDASIEYRVSGTATWDAISHPLPPPIECLVWDPIKGAYCMAVGCPCPTTYPIIIYDCHTGEICATFPANALCCAEGGTGVVAPPGCDCPTIAYDDGSGTVIGTPLPPSPRLKGVLWFVILPTTEQMFEEIDHELVDVGSAFDNVTPSVIPGGFSANAIIEGGEIGSQNDLHLHDADMSNGWTVDFWYYLPQDIPVGTFVNIIDLGTLFIRLTTVYGFAGTGTQLEAAVVGIDPLDPRPFPPVELHPSGPLCPAPIGWHHYIVTWSSTTNLITTYVDEVVQ